METYWTSTISTGCLYLALILSKNSGIRVNLPKDTVKKDHQAKANILPMISLVLIIEAPARTSIVIQGTIPKTDTRILEVVLTEATLRTETPTTQDMTNITVLKIDPAIPDQILRIKDTINQSLLLIIRMALTPELPVDLPDPELLVETTAPELQVDQTSIRIKADLQATTRKTEIRVHPTMEIQIAQLEFWKLNFLISETRNATHCYVPVSYTHLTLPTILLV